MLLKCSLSVFNIIMMSKNIKETDLKMFTSHLPLSLTLPEGRGCALSPTHRGSFVYFTFLSFICILHIIMKICL